MDNAVMETVFKFIDWFKLKIRLDSAERKIPIVNERDIWWISFGKNIGSEINGKSEWFSRPGIILKKISNGFYLVVPTTSKNHIGNWYVKIKQTKYDTYACLHQIWTLDYRRLSNRIGQIELSDFTAIKEQFHKFYK